MDIQLFMERKRIVVNILTFGIMFINVFAYKFGKVIYKLFPFCSQQTAFTIN